MYVTDSHIKFIFVALNQENLYSFGYIFSDSEA